MATQVRRTPSAYVIALDGTDVGSAFFTADGTTVTITHTEIDPSVEGHHLGSTLVQEALEDLRARGEVVVPQCPFVADYIDRHPDYADLVVG